MENIEISKSEKKRGIVIPNKMSTELAEEIGIHTGDGCLTKTKSSIMYSLRGSRTDDYLYYKEYMPALYKKLYNIKFNIRLWPDVIGFQFCSTSIGNFKNTVFDLPIGPKKNLHISDIILSNISYKTAFVRGFFDTDGGISFEKKSRDKPYYPRITLVSTSKRLLEQVATILKDDLDFNLSIWKHKYENKNWKDLHLICIRGSDNLNKWFKLVSSNNPKNRYKYNHWKKYGYAPVAQQVERLN